MRIKRLLGYQETTATTQFVSIALLVLLATCGAAGIGHLAFAQGSSPAQPTVTVAHPAEITPSDLSTQIQQMQGQLAQLDAIQSEAQQQANSGAHRGDQSQSDVSVKATQDSVDKRLDEAKSLNEQRQQQLDEAMQQLRISLDQLNSDEFRLQVAKSAEKASHIDSDQLQKQMDLARKSLIDATQLRNLLAAQLNSPEFKRQIENATLAASQVNTPEFKKQLHESVQAAVKSAELSRKANELLAQNTQPEAQSGNPAGPIRISSAVMAGNRILGPAPVYPPDAKAAHVQGVVVLHAIIGKTGAVENLQIVSGPSVLAASALDAVRQWTYKPYLLNGQPTEVETTINVHYTFGDDSQAAPIEEGVTASPTGPVRVSGGTMAGALISKVTPVYPTEAKAAHIQGIVILRAIISKSGTVENLQIVSGPPELTSSALDAVRQWQYKPYLLNGEPTEVQTTITVNYTLASPEEISTGAVSTMPTVTRSVEPEYTPEARKAKKSGTVLIGLVVDKIGNPNDVHVLKGLDSGLDQKAVQAVQQYHFKPAMRDGAPIAKDIRIEVNFQIF